MKYLDIVSTADWTLNIPSPANTGHQSAVPPPVLCEPNTAVVSYLGLVTITRRTTLGKRVSYG